MRWEDVNTPPDAGRLTDRTIRKILEADTDRRWKVCPPDPTRLIATVDAAGKRQLHVAGLLR